MKIYKFEQIMKKKTHFYVVNVFRFVNSLNFHGLTAINPLKNLCFFHLPPGKLIEIGLTPPQLPLNFEPLTSLSAFIK